jgi:hypothetical protein
VSTVSTFEFRKDVQLCEHHMHAKDAERLFDVLSSAHIIPAIIYLDRKKHGTDRTPLIVEAASGFLSTAIESPNDKDQWKDTTVALFELFKRIAWRGMLYVDFDPKHLSTANDGTFRLWNFDASKVLHMPDSVSDMEMWRDCAFYTMVWRLLTSMSKTVDAGWGFLWRLERRTDYDTYGIESFMQSLRDMFNALNYDEDKMKNMLQQMDCNTHNRERSVSMTKVFKKSCTVAEPTWSFGNVRIVGYQRFGPGEHEIIPPVELPEKKTLVVMDIVCEPTWPRNLQCVKVYEPIDRVTTAVTDDATANATPDVYDDTDSIDP